MASQSRSVILPYLRRLLADVVDEPGDPHLLDQFVRHGDTDAFAALVRRHGPMVLAVCRRLLADPHDAEDVFQATFLVLVRKASSVGRPERLANWLYGVAYRLSRKLRGQNARRHLREQPLVEVSVGNDIAHLVWREVRPILDEELDRLPEKYRVPVVLCYLEGVSKREAARQLGWPEGTLSTRLHQARLILRRRLARRGLELGAGVLSVLLAKGAAAAAVPSALATASFALATQEALVPTEVLSLTEGVLRAMWWSKLRVITSVLFAAGLLVASLSGAALISFTEPHQSKGPVSETAPATETPKKKSTEGKMFRLDKEVREVVWSPDGKLMASRATRAEKKEGGGEDERDFYSTVKVWDAATGKEIASLGELKNSGLVAMSFSPDGAVLNLSYFRQIQEGTRIEFWDARKGDLKKTIEMDYGRMAPKFAISPDGKTLAVLYAGEKDRDKKKSDLNGGVMLFDVAKGEAIRTVRGHTHMAISLAYSPDGKLLATGGSQHDGDIRLWDLSRDKAVRVLKTDAVVPAVAFAPDGKVLASGQGDGRVILWDATTGKELRVLQDAPSSTWAVAFSPDGRLIAAVGPIDKDNKRTYSVRLWNATSGDLLRSWEDTGASFGFTPDGKLLSILGKDGAVRLWELKGSAPDADVKADYGFGKLIDQLIQDKKTDGQAVEWLFVAAMGRFPAERERQFLVGHLAQKKDRRAAMLDVVWVIMNSKEYLARLDALNRNDPRKILRKN